VGAMWAREKEVGGGLVLSCVIGCLLGGWVGGVLCGRGRAGRLLMRISLMEQVHTGPIHPPTNTIMHMGIVGLVFLAKVHEVGLLLGTLAWA
jgi:hypothetical protein